MNAPLQKTIEKAIKAAKRLDCDSVTIEGDKIVITVNSGENPKTDVEKQEKIIL